MRGARKVKEMAIRAWLGLTSSAAAGERWKPQGVCACALMGLAALMLEVAAEQALESRWGWGGKLGGAMMAGVALWFALRACLGRARKTHESMRLDLERLRLESAARQPKARSRPRGAKRL